MEGVPAGGECDDAVDDDADAAAAAVAMAAIMYHRISYSPKYFISTLGVQQDNLSPKNSKGQISKKMATVSGSWKNAPRSNLSQNEARKQISKKIPKSNGARSTSKTASHSRGKIIKKYMGTHKLLFTKDGLPDGIEVTYIFGGKPQCKGFKADTGIFCFCCNTVISPSQFESHAGFKSRRKPYSYIYIDIEIDNEQKSLSLDSFSSILHAKGVNHSPEWNEDDEDVLFCGRCSDSFRRASLSLLFVPSGKWYCKSCRESLQTGDCGKHDAVAYASVSGVLSENQLADPCNYIETEFTACVLCGEHIFERSGFGPQTVIFCDQCDKEYHVGCLKKHNMADLKELPEEEWFCCLDCRRIYTVLKDLVVSGAEKLSDSILDITREKLNGKDVKSVIDMDVRWRLVDTKAVSQESKLLLSETLALFHDCFSPIVDQVTKVDLIRSMVYGEKVRDQDFSGMYCAILTVNSSVVSAGLLRVFGSDVAELPLVATSKQNQGKGYLRLLFSCVEKLLSFMNVKSFVLPAASQTKAFWMNKFGFEKLPSKQLNRYNNTCCPIVAFQGTVLLSKAVPQCEMTCRDASIFDLSA